MSNKRGQSVMRPEWSDSCGTRRHSESLSSIKSKRVLCSKKTFIKCVVKEQFIIFLVIKSLDTLWGDYTDWTFWSSWRERSFVRLYGYIIRPSAREIWNFKIIFSLNFISSRKLKLKLCTQNTAQNEWIPFDGGLVAGCWAGILAYAHGLTLMNFLFQFFASGQTISRERLLLPTTKNNHWFKEN